MKIEDVKIDSRKKPDSEKANKSVSIRITEKLSKWLRDNEISPTALFYEAVKELGFKEKKNEKLKK